MPASNNILPAHIPVLLSDGRYGRILQACGTHTKTCDVVLDTGEKIPVVLEEFSVLPVGTPLILAFLVDNPEYNDRKAWVTGYDSRKQKYSARLHGSYKEVILPHRAVIPVRVCAPNFELPARFEGEYAPDPFFPHTLTRLVPTERVIDNWTSCRVVYGPEEHSASIEVTSLHELLAPPKMSYWDARQHRKADTECQRDLELLLDAKADPNSHHPQTGDTPLHIALSGGRFGHAHAWRTLVEYGADLIAANRAGETILELALADGRFDLAKVAEERSIEARYSWVVYCELCRSNRATASTVQPFSFMTMMRNVVGIGEQSQESQDRMEGVVRGMARLPMQIFRSLMVQVFPIGLYDWNHCEFYEEWPTYRRRQQPKPDYYDDY